MQCPWCPTDPANAPEHTLTPESPMSTLPCGHAVHTHCLINHFVQNYMRATCGTCQARVVEDRIDNFYNYNERPRTNIANLWATSEEFRNDIKELKKRYLAFHKIHKVHNSSVRALQNRFKENINLSLETIKQQKHAITQEYRRLPTKREHSRLITNCYRKLNQIRGAYNVSYWELRNELRDIAGAPKFNQANYYKWRYNPRYFFRVRL